MLTPATRDYLRGAHPTDALAARIVLEYEIQRAGFRRDNPYPSQEFVTVLNTGRAMNADAWQENCKRDAVLKAQTDYLADALERTGIPARGPDNVVSIGLVTGEIESLDRYRSICFLPNVAQRDRRPMLNELRAFQQGNKIHGKYMRMGVVTSGAAIPLGDMPPTSFEGEPREGKYFECRDRIKKLSRDVSNLARWARDEFDIDVSFRGTEFTIARRKGNTVPSIHVHANVLYTAKCRLTKREWRAFLDRVPGQIGGAWWKDCGILKDPKEAIKYAFKPAELAGLTDGQIRWLYEQTFGLKMTHPLGDFKTWRNDTLYRTETRWDGLTVRRKHRKVLTLEYGDGSRRISLCSVMKRPGKTKKDLPVVRNDDSSVPENLVMTYTMPQRRFSPYAEPCALVMGYTQSPHTEMGEDALKEITARGDVARAIWDMNGAPAPEIALAVGLGQAAAREGEADRVKAFIVHTRSSTAGKKSRISQSHGPPVPIDSSARSNLAAVDEYLATG